MAAEAGEMVTAVGAGFTVMVWFAVTEQPLTVAVTV